MKQYIDKDDVVKEVKRIKNEECPTDTYEGRCKLFWFEQFLAFLNTLEIKEMDLDKYYIDFLKREWHGKPGNRTISEMMAFTAKHFFELGLKARKGEEL